MATGTLGINVAANEEGDGSATARSGGEGDFSAPPDESAEMPPPPVAPDRRCTSAGSSVSSASQLRRSRLRYVLLIDRDSRAASLRLCACPRCSGLLSFRRAAAPPPPGDEEDEEDPPKLRGVTDEEQYELRCATKADRRLGYAAGSARPKAANRGARKREEADKRMMSKPGAARKVRLMEMRAEERQEQLARRKERIRERVATDPEGYWERRLNPPPRTAGEEGGYSGFYTSSGERVQVLSAAELGVEEGAMYDRLLRIMEGAEIRPEDYDLLLQLDENNVRKTMEVSQVSKFEVLAVAPDDEGAANGSGGGATVTREGLGDGLCLICLVPFTNLDDGAELRRLPCEHMYCKSCIDQWLTKNSIRCPDLSCFWVPDDGNTEKDQNEMANVTVVGEGSAQAEQGVADAGAEGTPEEPTAIDERLVRYASDRLWPVADVETCLGEPPAEGGLTASNILELLSDLATQLWHQPTLDVLQLFFDESDATGGNVSGAGVLDL